MYRLNKAQVMCVKAALLCLCLAWGEMILESMLSGMSSAQVETLLAEKPYGNMAGGVPNHLIVVSYYRNARLAVAYEQNKVVRVFFWKERGHEP